MLITKTKLRNLHALLDNPSQELIQFCNDGGSKEIWEVKEVPLNFGKLKNSLHVKNNSKLKCMKSLIKFINYGMKLIFRRFFETVFSN